MVSSGPLTVVSESRPTPPQALTSGSPRTEFAVVSDGLQLDTLGPTRSVAQIRAGKAASRSIPEVPSPGGLSPKGGGTKRKGPDFGSPQTVRKGAEKGASVHVAKRRNSPKKSKNPVTSNPGSPQVLDDQLGTLVSEAVHRLSSSPSWSEFVAKSRGRPYISEQVQDIPHPAADFLQDTRLHGIPARADDEDWTQATKDECYAYGVHATATAHKDFIREEMAEFMQSGFWTVLPYRMVRELPKLRISPLGVKEERERKPRLVCDHSFFGVNEHTIPWTPEQVMQFGGTLPRILQAVRHADPARGPVYLSKFDIKDGYYRIFLEPDACPTLAVTLPRYDGEEPLVAIPLVLTMGWAESPPAFCSVSETIADLANDRARNPNEPPHRLEVHCEPMDVWNTEPSPNSDDDDVTVVTSHVTGAPHLLEPTGADPIPFGPDGSPAPEEGRTEPARLPDFGEAPAPNPLPQPPNKASNRKHKHRLCQVDVFVDDFIGVCQGTRRQLRNLRRNILHSIDLVFDEPRPGEDNRNEAASLKKLLKGDGSWDTRKLILGWIIDTALGTIELPEHRKERLLAIFDDLRGKRRIGKRKWQRYLGELRFVGPGVPGSAGLFGALQLGLTESTEGRVKLSQYIRDHLADFERLVRDLASRPTRLAELVTEDPTVLQAVDAAKAGMGGVVFAEGKEPRLWRAPFPPDIQKRVVSEDNPSGDLTNSDLEQAALLAGADVVASLYDVREATIASLSDNTPAISRKHKGAISADAPGAYLCRLSSLHRRHYRYAEETSHIAGDANSMADDASRLQHLTVPQLLTHFELHYPQATSWTFCQLDSEMERAIHLALSRKPEPALSWSRPSVPEQKLGRSGEPFATRWSCPAASDPCQNGTGSLSSHCGGNESGRAKKPKAVNPSELARWRVTSQTWGRFSPNWVSRIPACGPGPIATRLPTRNGLWACNEGTPRPRGCTPAASESCGPSTPLRD